MAKARIWGKSEDGIEEAKGVIVINCPGCGCHHVIFTKEPAINGAKWNFNDDFEKPTFSPSLLIRTGHFATGEKMEDCGWCKESENICGICHSFIRDGRIQFLDDCTHKLKGQTVELPDII